jgi:tetratricopeptide (TPR) repeat protein
MHEAGLVLGKDRAMRRGLWMLSVLVATVAVTPSADAFWPCLHGCGGGYYGCGYGGWGCGVCDCTGYGPFAFDLYAYRPFIYPRIVGGSVVLPMRSPALGYPPFAMAAPDITVRRSDPPPAESDLTQVVVRVTTIENRRKAERMLGEGDELFRAQKYHSALQRYKLAASTAPRLAEAHWRKGHGLVATHNYELAVSAFKRAIDLSDDVSRGGFRLADIYGSAAMAKDLQLESAAEWALGKSDSPEAWLLVGIFLHYDGQSARAKRFLTHAAALGGEIGEYVAVFDKARAAPKPARLTSSATEL